MSDTLVSLRRKIKSAGDLQSVVRTMKVLAASSISQYEKSVQALGDYCRTVELGLGACFRKTVPPGNGGPTNNKSISSRPGAIVFGSDQGLVGQFNDTIAEYAIQILSTLPGKPIVWAMGERVHARLSEAGMNIAGLFVVPNSVKAITPLVAQLQIESESRLVQDEEARLYLFHNRPQHRVLYEPVCQRLLPLDIQWQEELAELPWPTQNLPEVLGGGPSALRALLHEHLFISLFRSCAESLASENASRLAAMERADKNIQELLEDLTRAFHRLRQSSIDEELFDVIAGCEFISH